MFHQREQQRFPPIAKPQRFKLLQDVTQQPYRIGMVQYYPAETKKILTVETETDKDESGYNDPGREVVDRNRKERLTRISEDAKEELDKVLRRVDNTMNNYEYAVQSSLVQHGMSRADLSNVEHVADIRELENLLNDSLAKQKYKQRLMVFIVGQSEQANEKAKLLNQLGQFFIDQKQNFSGAEFNEIDDSGETFDEIETTLKSFDVKECYAHVKTLGNRINELNEEIIQFLVQNTGTKQTKVMVERGKRKLTQVTKEAKEQLADLQSKLEMANAEMMGRDGKIQMLEKDVETVRVEIKTSQENQKKIQDDLKRREAELKFFKRRNGELEDILNRHKNQIGDLASNVSASSQSETEDGDDATKVTLNTIDEIESKHEKESVSSFPGKEPGQSMTAPPSSMEPTTTTNTTGAKVAAGAPAPAVPNQQAASKGPKKSKTRDKSKRNAFRSKKEAANQNGAEDPGEIYRRSQQLLESLLGDKTENAPDLNTLFKAARGVDLNNVTIDNLPTAFTNLRKFAIARVKDVLKELETKESANKETVQTLKHEFVEHKTTYEKERLMYFLNQDPDESGWQEEQNALVEKADNAHKLQMKAQKTAEDALNHLELFMVEQEKLDQQDVDRQTELVHRHSVVVSNMTGVNISPSERADAGDETAGGNPSPNSKGSMPVKNPWQKLTTMGSSSSRQDTVDEPKATLFQTAQTLKRLSSNLRKTPPPKLPQQLADSIEQPAPAAQQHSSPTSLLRKTTQDLLRKKSFVEPNQPPSNDRSNSSSRRISMVVNDEQNPPPTKIAAPHPFERSPSMQSRTLTRSNSINPANKDQDKSSSGERSQHTSAAQSRRVSMGLNRSPVRAEDLEKLLAKVVNEEVEALENFRKTSVKSRTSLREKYLSLLEEKKHELDDLKQQADVTLSRPNTSNKERKSFGSLENAPGLLKQRSSSSLFDGDATGDSTRSRENRKPTKKQDQQQQTSRRSSRTASAHKDKADPSSAPTAVHADQYKVPFFHLYENIYKFRHTMISLLEQNKFISLADRLEMIKQISSMDNMVTNDFVDNSDRVLKDTAKVLQTCMTTLMTTIHENENKLKEASSEQAKAAAPLAKLEANVEEKQPDVSDLHAKYQQISQSLDQNNEKHREERMNNALVMDDQQKLIQSLQRELTRAQHRLSKIERQGVVAPSIMFTRLDAQRNEQTLKQAVEKGKVPEATFNEVSQAMDDYVRLPSQQFSNLVERYIQHRRATEVQSRVEGEPSDDHTKATMKKMGSYYEKRAGQISERIASIRQHRTTLARTLTDKLDQLENASSLFLIRPVYSYQGRSAVKTYTENEKRAEESSGDPNERQKKHHRRRRPQSKSTDGQPGGHGNRQRSGHSLSASSSGDDESSFQIRRSLTSPKVSLASQVSANTTESTHIHPHPDTTPNAAHASQFSRLQELDIQRTLLSTSHASATLPSANAHSDSSSNLRSYVPLARPGITDPTTGEKPIDPTTHHPPAVSTSNVGTKPTAVHEIRHTDEAIPSISVAKSPRSDPPTKDVTDTKK